MMRAGILGVCSSDTWTRFGAPPVGQMGHRPMDVVTRRDTTIHIPIDDDAAQSPCAATHGRLFIPKRTAAVSSMLDPSRPNSGSATISTTDRSYRNRAVRADRMNGRFQVIGRKSLAPPDMTTAVAKHPSQNA